MSAWTHVLCSRCWYEHTVAVGQAGREPTVVRDAPIEPCCRCGKPTDAGIFVRGDPNKFPCGGKGGTHEDAPEGGAAS